MLLVYIEPLWTILCSHSPDFKKVDQNTSTDSTTPRKT